MISARRDEERHSGRVKTAARELDDWGAFREGDLTQRPPRTPALRSVLGRVGLARRRDGTLCEGAARTVRVNCCAALTGLTAALLNGPPAAAPGARSLLKVDHGRAWDARLHAAGLTNCS